MKRRASLALAVATAVAVPSCGTTTSTTSTSLNLNRPVDVAFACGGTLRIPKTLGQPGTITDPVLYDQAVPISDCDGFAAARIGVVDSNSMSLEDDTKLPVGQENLVAKGGAVLSVSYYAFILQSVPGTLAVATWKAKSAFDITGAEVSVVDIDPLTPGPNSISIGDSPVGLGTDRNGCFELTANAGTCDLSVLDISSVLGTTPNPIVDRLGVIDGGGKAVLARPYAMVMEPTSGPVGVSCQGRPPAGIAYVAYPDCHSVAAIDVATGAIKAHVDFAADGSATVALDGNLACPAQCGDTVATPTAGVRPVALDLQTDNRVDTVKLAPTRTLAIGADNSDRVTYLALGPDFLPTAGAAPQIKLADADGTLGVTSVAVSPQIGMGGDAGAVSDDPNTGAGAAPAGQFQFIYAVANDGTVRVADILGVDDHLADGTPYPHATECDTEIDPRYLIGTTDIHYLSCMPIDDPSRAIGPTVVNPPRRPGVRGPGIEMVGAAKPISVTIVHALPSKLVSTGPSPSTWEGYFASITTTTGGVYTVDVDDDNYPDTDDPTKPLSRTLPLALPHQLRDRIAGRDNLAESSETINGVSTQVLVCNYDGHDPNVTSPDQLGDGPRLWPTDTTSGHPIAVATSNAQIDPSKIFELPTIRQVLCTSGDVTGVDVSRPVSSLAFSAPADVRKAAFPDLRAMRADETWYLTWEGSLSNDATSEFIDGPITRIGQAIVDGTGMRMVETSHPYCDMGVEPFDEVILRGCDPSATGQCGIGMTCYVHPDSTTGLGTCLPSDQVDALSDACREFLRSQRRFAATTVKSGELRLIPRRHVLDTTPVDGCTSSQQCDQLAILDARNADPSNPYNDTTTARPTPSSTVAVADQHAPTWACEADPSRPGPNECVQTCSDDAHCYDGSICQEGRCVDGVVPPLQCLPGVQRYEVHAARAFTVVGNTSGYQHGIIRDAATDTCVKNPNASPLMIGRIPLTAPPCTGDGPTDIGPNPCSTTVKQTEYEPKFAGTDPNQPCLLDPTTGTQMVTRDAPAIRFRNPQMTFEMVDPTYPSDAQCIGDRKGGLANVPILFHGYSLQVRIVSGFLPYLLGVNGVSYAVKVVRGPQQSIWVADDGDDISTTTTAQSVRGKVFAVQSSNPNVVDSLF